MAGGSVGDGVWGKKKKILKFNNEVIKS